MKKYDFMVIGAHADDVELAMGGTVLKMTSAGAEGIIVDMTVATAASRGTPEQRIREANTAASILGVGLRLNLGFEDAALLPTSEKPLLKLIEIIRQYQPKMIFTHYSDDFHPDHMATCELVKNAWYKAGLTNFHSELGAGFRPARIFHFMGSVMVAPTFCVDISRFWEQKIKSIEAYESQFYNSNSSNYKGKSQISTPEFMDFIKTRFRFLGSQIRTEYAEPFWCRELAEVQNPLELGRRAF